MTSQWTAFLDQQGAVRDTDGSARHLGQPVHAGDSLFACDHLAIITLRGPDSIKFLQGQLTADARDLEKGLSRLAMHLSLKGRGMVSMRLLPADDGADILVPRMMADTLIERLKKYILFSKAELARDETRVVIGVSGNSAETLAAAGLPSPDPDNVIIDGQRSILNAGNRHLLLLGIDDAIQLWPTLAEGRTPGAADLARLAEIQAGEAHILPGAEDLFLPQVLNYDLTGGVSFNKGCYVGQEVVARMHFKGKLKQRMQYHQWQGSHNAAPGSVIRNSEGSAIGEVVMVVASAERTDALVVVRLDHEGGYGVEMEGEVVDMVVERSPLPYEDQPDA